AASSWLLFRLTADHFGQRAGLWATAFFTLAPFFFLSAGSWLVPDGPLLFFLALCALALSRITFADESAHEWGWWLIFGGALGFALLSKYHAALFATGAAILFAASPRLRAWLARPQPYV